MTNRGAAGAASWWPVALLVALAAPSADGVVFDGLPLSTWPEFIVLMTVLPLAVSSRFRRYTRRSIVRLHPMAGRVAFGLCIAAGLIKLGAGLTSTPAGFLACYETAVPTDRPLNGCERSYENLFNHRGVTRIDPSINFRRDDWNLSFFNSTRFNFYEPGSYLRRRLPFEVIWSGEIDTPSGRELAIRYAGEGTLEIGGDHFVLPPVYDQDRQVTHALSPGRQRFMLRYRFDDGSRNGVEPDGPGATMRVLLTGGDEADAPAVPLRAAAPSFTQVAAGWIADGLIGGLASVSGLLLIGALWPDRRSLVVAGAAAVGVAFEPRGGDQRYLLLISLTALAWGMLFQQRRRTRRLLFAYAAAVALTIGWLVSNGLTSGTVVLRDGGNDWLTYESFARSILETSSLQGGEDVFWLQPLSRYLRFGLHVIAGDGDAFMLVIELLAVNLSVIWLCWTARRSRQQPVIDRLLACSATFLLFVLINSRGGALPLVERGASETWTWVLIPLTLGLLFDPSMRRYRGIGVAALSAALITRFNHAPAILLMLAAFLLLNRRESPKRLAGWMAAFGLIAVLPLAHNVYYGRTFVLTTDQATFQGNLRGTPDNAEARPGERQARLRRSLEGILYLGDDPQGRSWVFHGLQLVYLATIVTAVTRGRRAWPWLLLAMVPVAHLATYLVYIVGSYYPRHIIAGHIAMGAVVLLLGTLTRSPGQPHRVSPA